jgi:DNA invertase Pin-like site-specific DNA recombinase
MNVAYIRVSTAQQNEARQFEMMKDKDIGKYFHEKVSGKDTNRKELKAMLDYVREGDTVYVESISRIARNTIDLLRIVADLEKKNVDFVSLKEAIDTRTPTGKFMLTVFGALAELERENTLERQREGIAIAKSEKKYKGRVPIKIDETLMRETCGKWRNGEITATKAMEIVGLKPNTFYRRVEEMGL